MRDILEQQFATFGGIVPIKGLSTPASAAEIEAFEKSLDVKLPSDYRDLLMEYGAARFNESVCFRPLLPLPDRLMVDGKGLFSFFFDLSENSYGILRQIERYRDRMPANTIPIAESEGDKICLIISGDEAGRIYHWDKANDWDREEFEEEYGRPILPEEEFSNMYLIADSFEDLILRMEPEV